MSLSFVTPYVAMSYYVIPEKQSEPLCVSTPVVNSTLAKRVYLDYPICINHKSTMAKLTVFDKVDFDVILNMYKFHTCYDLVDCRTRIIKFNFTNESALERKSSSAVPKSCFILYLKQGI